jgi:hypothetical protein
MAAAGDIVYWGFLEFDTDIRLEKGDYIKVNFVLQGNSDDEDWDFRVIDPPEWAVQGEVVGALYRPRQPAPENATTAQKRAVRPFQKTKLPVDTAIPNSPSEFREALANAKKIKCLLKFSPSIKAYSRNMVALQNLSLGSRKNHNYGKRDNTLGKRIDNPMMQNNSRFFLMHDPRPDGTGQIISNKLIEQCSFFLPDEDQEGVLEYLTKVPKSKQGLEVAVTKGLEGAGKSTLIGVVATAWCIEIPPVNFWL